MKRWSGLVVLLVAFACGDRAKVDISPEDPPPPKDAPSASASASVERRAPPHEPLETQCKRLIEVINREQKPIREMSVSGTNAESFMTLGKVLDGVATNVEAVRVTDETLAKLQKEYVGLARDLAQASREGAKALEGTNIEATMAALKKLQSYTPNESKIVDAINEHCSDA